MKLSISKGRAYTLRYAFRSSEIAITDISDWSFWFSVKDNIEDSDADAYIYKETSDVIISNDKNDNPTILSIPLSELDTDIPVGEYFYDAWIKIPYDDNLVMLESAKLRITQPVTRSL